MIASLISLANKPFELTGRHQLSASAPQAHSTSTQGQRSLGINSCKALMFQVNDQN